MEHIKVYCKNLEETAELEVDAMANNPCYEDCLIRIMPDAHAGKGCTIGTTILAPDGFTKLNPELVGVDIGCGVQTLELDRCLTLKEIDVLDNILLTGKIPSGNSHYEEEQPFLYERRVDGLIYYICSGFIRSHGTHQPSSYADIIGWKNISSLGTLGGGNHFIEIDTNGKHDFITVHSGSRSFGSSIANFYTHLSKKKVNKEDINTIINKYKAQHREKELESVLIAYKKKALPKGYLEGKNLKDYFTDMEAARLFADLNRNLILRSIRDYLHLEESHVVRSITSVHNYIDPISNILRKGAVSAKQDEDVIIPLNMKDGVLICKGKGNQDWNYSAPHGAGRKLSRTQAKELITLDEYKESMHDVISSTVNLDTIDEAPSAYKPAEDIIEAVTPSVDIIQHLTVKYNFKAATETKPREKK